MEGAAGAEAREDQNDAEAEEDRTDDDDSDRPTSERGSITVLHRETGSESASEMLQQSCALPVPVLWRVH